MQQKESVSVSSNPPEVKKSQSVLTPSTSPPAVKPSEPVLTPSTPPAVKVPVERLSPSKMKVESKKVVTAVSPVATKMDHLEMNEEERIDKYMVRCEGTVKRIVVDVDQFRHCKLMLLIVRCRGYNKWLYYYCAIVIPFIYYVSYKIDFNCLLQMCF